MSCPSVWFRCHFASEVRRRAILHFAVLALLAAFAAVAAQAQTSCTVSLATDSGSGTNGTGPGSGSGSSGDLRYCINYVNSNGGSGSSSINFDTTVFRSSNTVSQNTIPLSGSLPAITANVTITGPTGGSGSTLQVVTVGGSIFYGGIFQVTSGATLTIDNLNMMNGGSSTGGGGAIWNNGSGALTVTNSYFSNSLVSQNGGAILNSGGGALTVTNCTFIGNQAEYGAGIWNNGTMTVTGSYFSQNYAGGAIYSSGALTVTGSTFFANWAENGGAIGNNGGTVTVTNSTFSVNSAVQNGGAIWNNTGGTLAATNNTFSGNGAPTGGAIYNSGALTAVNDILYFSRTSSGGAIGNGGTITEESNNVFSNNSGGDVSGFSSSASDVTGKDARLAPIAWYGGPASIRTMILLPGSAAICAGSASAASSAGVAVDERGFALDPACPSGAVDAGAIQTNQYMVTTTNDASDASPTCASGTGSACSLRDALALNNVTAGDITFAPSLSGTIPLGQGSAGDNPLPQITGTLNLLGPGANLVTISGNHDANVGSIFTVNGSGATAFFYGLIIANGIAGSDGGGAILNGGTLTVTDSTFSENQASSGNGEGGAIGVYAGTLNVTNSTFYANSALSGGAIWNNNPNAGVTVTNSTFYGNLATFAGGAEGGAIENYTGSLNVDNSTFYGNQAPGANGEGGAISNIEGEAWATNNIFSGNSASSGGAIYFEPNFYGEGITESYNDYDSSGGNDSVSGFTMSGTDQTGPADLSSLGWYGGLTQTMIPLSGSSALCAGLASDEYYTTDQRGAPLATCSNSSYIDIGSVQVSGNPPLIAVSPISGPVAGGTTVAITGSGLDSATAVDFGSTPAASFSVTAASGTTPAYVTAVSPVGSIGIVDVTVANSSGTSIINPADEFTYEQATPTVSGWPTASPITYGETLASSTLSGGTASVTGSFAWTAPSTAPAVGTASYSVTFTPNDTTDYATVTGPVSVAVNQALPTISAWPTASPITDGETLASSTLSGGTASVTGSFAWTTPSTTPALGTTSYSVTFTPNDTTDYATATGSVSVTVTAAATSITIGFSGSSAQTVAAGGSANYSFAVTPAPAGSTFANAVTFSVSGLPTGATATFSPSSIAAGSGATNVKLTIQTASTSAQGGQQRLFGKAAPLALALLLLPLWRSRRRARRWLALGTVLGVLTATAALTGCGGSNGGSSSVSSGQSYSITITATSGTVTQSSVVSLTVE